MSYILKKLYCKIKISKRIAATRIELHGFNISDFPILYTVLCLGSQSGAQMNVCMCVCVCFKAYCKSKFFRMFLVLILGGHIDPAQVSPNMNNQNQLLPAPPNQ